MSAAPRVEEFERRAALIARRDAGDEEAARILAEQGWGGGEPASTEVEESQRPKVDRSRLGQVRESLDARRADRARIEEELRELRQRQDEAVSAAVRSAPKRRVFGVGSEASKLAARADKVERSLPLLDREIAELERLEAELRNEDAERIFEEYRSDARRLRERQITALRSAGLDFARLVRDYLAMAAAAEAAGELRGRAIKEGVVPDEESWNRECAPALTPYPTDLLRFITKLADVTIDPHSHGYREESSGALRADHGGLLKTLTPDLRRLARNSYPTGRFDRTASEGWLSGQQPRWSHLPDPGSLDEIIARLAEQIEDGASS